MEPFAHDKDEAAKKVIVHVAANSSGNHGLKARSSKSAGSPRHGKNRAAKSYSGTHNSNSGLINLSWPGPPGLGSQLSPGNMASPEKIPLGHYRTGSSFENSHPDMQLNSSKFLSDSNVAKFNATLFSSASNHASQGLDVEEAMDIDNQEGNDEAACVGGSSDASVLLDANVSCQPQASEEKSLPEKYPIRGGSDSSATPGAKPKELKREMPVTNQTKEVNEQKPQILKTTSTTLSNRKKAIYIVVHISTIQIGELIGKASAPVKIYAEKMFIEMETNEGVGNKTVSHHFRIPCKDLTECKANFGGAPLLFVVKPTPAGATAIQEKCKEKGRFLDPESQDMKKRYIVLVMNYKVVPRDIKADLIELFQNRFAGQLSWSELSAKEAQDILDKKEDADSSLEESNTTQSPKPVSPGNIEHRKILTPKGKLARKKLFSDGSKSAPTKMPVSPSSSGAKDTEPECMDEQTKEKDHLPDTAIQTRSRRRKATSAVTNSDSKPEATGSEPVKLDILLHHKEMESHITLLDQHSKEQRENLQQHQKLLEIERGKLLEMEEEKERHLGRMRDLEIGYSTDKERFYERIRVLENALLDKDHTLTQQAVNLAVTNNDLEQERVSVRQLQNELEQEREANSHLRKVQSDLVRVRRALDEEKTVRNMREQQLREKETNFHGLQGTLGEEQQARLRLEEELRQARSACNQIERSLENERLSNESRREDVQVKEDTITEQLRLLQQEREQKRDLEDRLRSLQIQVDEERNRRILTERELTEERMTLQQDRENLERERGHYEQRIRDCERAASESEHRLRELQSAVSAAQEALAEYRRLEPRDWIIRREEVAMSASSLGVGAWGKVYQGTFRGCQVAVKQIHELILSPHNRRLFEREMSIASRCRHPHLLQFIGATNDDGSPLFITELLDTDLRNVLTQRALHQEEIICLALDVARGLNYLHLNKPFPIIHRDISSSNVLLWRRDDSWRAKLSDYGAANFMRQYMTVNPGARIYAAPEALTSQQSPKADVFSFGLLLCEMCIRELPVPQQIQEQIGLVTNGVLRELIMRCVVRDPEARPAISDVIMVLAQQAESLRAQGLVTLNGRTATL